MRYTFLLPALSLILVATSGTGCYYDVEEEMYGSRCDTTTVRYATTITGIINNNGCLGCHAGSTPSAGFNFETHAGIKAAVDAGRLLGAISHSPGFRPMPDGGPKMNACDIDRVRAWINAGAPNN